MNQVPVDEFNSLAADWRHTSPADQARPVGGGMCGPAAARSSVPVHMNRQIQKFRTDKFDT